MLYRVRGAGFQADVRGSLGCPGRRREIRQRRKTAVPAVSAETASAAVSAVRDTLPGTAAAAVSAGTAAAVGGESIVYRVRDLTAAASGGDEGSGEMGSGETGGGDTAVRANAGADYPERPTNWPNWRCAVYCRQGFCRGGA